MRALSAPCILSSFHLNHHPNSFLPRYKSIPMTLFQFPNTLNFSSTKKDSTFRSTAGEKIQASALPTSVPVRVAHEMLQAGHRYLDVRTPEEYSTGRAVGAVNVPYMFKAGSGMTKNPGFLDEVSSNFDKDDKIIVGCLAGKRSIMAANDLVSAGFTEVTDIAGGYAEWVQNGLPTES